MGASTLCSGVKLQELLLLAYATFNLVGPMIVELGFPFTLNFATVYLD
jgi:hypothetical protein